MAEYDDLRMLSDLGYDVFCPGGYADPSHPATDMRPPLQLPYRADLDALCHAQRAKHSESDAWAIDWAKADLHSDLIDWADAIIVHHFPERWIAGQWPRLKGKRVIWRTCGQSNPDLERYLAPLHKAGLQIVRYSPKERIAFESIHAFAGEDAMIRFGKYPADWYGWTGEDAVVGNVTQDMVGRADFCGLRFWNEATEGLPVKPAGQNSEVLGGVGSLSYDAMREYLRKIRVYLYTGTQPASYTLGLIEALMTGTPVVSVGPERMWMPALFEGHEIAKRWTNDPVQARTWLWELLQEPATNESMAVRERAMDLFAIQYVGYRWQQFLGTPTPAVPQPEMATA